MNACFATLFSPCRLGEETAEIKVKENYSSSTPSWRRLKEFKETSQNLRRLQDNDVQTACDAQFVACLKSPNCVECFVELETKVSRAPSKQGVLFVMDDYNIS